MPVAFCDEFCLLVVVLRELVKPTDSFTTDGKNVSNPLGAFIGEHTALIGDSIAPKRTCVRGGGDKWEPKEEAARP